MLGRPGCLWVEFRRLHYCLIKANVFPNRDNDRTSLKPISSAKESVNLPLEGLCCLRPSQSIYSILCHSGLSIRVTTSAQTNSRIHHEKGPLTPDVAVLRRQPEPPSANLEARDTRQFGRKITFIPSAADLAGDVTPLGDCRRGSEPFRPPLAWRHRRSPGRGRAQPGWCRSCRPSPRDRNPGRNPDGGSGCLPAPWR